MVAGGGVVSSSGTDVYRALPNNTNASWFKDKGLRRLNFGVILMFASAAANGYDGALMNGLLALPMCEYLFLFFFFQCLLYPSGLCNADAIAP